MNIQTLSHMPFGKIADCFLAAFKDYFVPMPADKLYYAERWKAAKVDFGFSYGMFDRQRLVGFVLHAVDQRNNVKAAYNAGTGVLPEYRKEGIVQSLYARALEDMTQHGIEKIRLEVITQNEAAIRSYEGIGFRKCKTYHCFKGHISLPKETAFELETIPMERVQWESLPNQVLYSWENQQASILAGNYQYFQVMHNKLPESYFIIKPKSGYLAQLDLLNPTQTAWNRIFAAIKHIAPSVQLNNVEEHLEDKMLQLTAHGLKPLIDQYEMELML